MGSISSSIDEQEYSWTPSEEASLLGEIIVHLPITRYNVRNTLKPEFQAVLHLISDQARGEIYVGAVASGIKQRNGIWLTKEPQEFGGLVKIWSEQLRARVNNLAVVYWTDRFEEALEVRNAVIKTLQDRLHSTQCISAYEPCRMEYAVYVAWWHPIPAN